MPETRGIFSYLTARENLEIARRPGSRWPMESMLERFPKLREVLDRKGRFLSGGEQQMLAIARALLTGPELLLLDEPSQGLAPLVVEAVMGTVRELKRERVSMLLVEQNAEMALAARRPRLRHRPRDDRLRGHAGRSPGRPADHGDLPRRRRLNMDILAAHAVRYPDKAALIEGNRVCKARHTILALPYLWWMPNDGPTEREQITHLLH